jgi:ABC-type antimicrobial peptide transport system permease subunit
MHYLRRTFRTALRTLGTALHALRRNIMRSALTCLGIIIGIAAVIAMMEIGNGSSSAIQKTIASMGANSLLVLPGTASSGGISFGAGTALTLTPDDCEAIIRECGAVRVAAPIVRAHVTVVYQNQNWVPSFIYGTTPAYLEARDWTDMAEGSPFTDQDVRSAAKVCLLGQTEVRELFKGESPIGKEIRMQNVSFKVIGVLSFKGANMMGMDQDDVVLAPWTTIKYRVSGNSASTVNQSAAGSDANAVNSLSNIYPSAALSLYETPTSAQLADTPQPVRFTNVDQILCAANSTGDAAEAISQITELLHERHRIKAGQLDDFSIRDMTEINSAFASTSSRMTNLLLCVALISLIVGGVGIMNIMLVSVTERTREIGLRMAVGARGGDILRQFLIEAVLLCLAGGIIGILIGRGGSWAVHHFLRYPTEISVPTIIIAVAVSAAVGIIFGFYPAWKASQLDPIDALRYE